MTQEIQTTQAIEAQETQIQVQAQLVEPSQANEINEPSQPIQPIQNLSLQMHPQNDLENYLAQALNDEVRNWIGKNLKNYLAKLAQKAVISSNIANSQSQCQTQLQTQNHDEIEHIIDYLNSPEAPQRLEKMSYAQAKSNAEKWLKTQIKKGKTIEEVPSDFEVFLDFNDGFKFVKLLGENAYKKEGFLMSHCVAGYYHQKNSEIYSLRDKKNNPHATIEVEINAGCIEQIKGKGNGSIHPLYAGYILQFISKINLEVSPYDLSKFGYQKVASNLFEKIKSTKGLVFLKIKANQYLYIKSEPQNLSKARVKK